MNGGPEYSVELVASNGQWIMTQYSDERVQIKLFNDDKGRQVTFWIEGRIAMTVRSTEELKS